MGPDLGKFAVCTSLLRVLEEILKDNMEVHDLCNSYIACSYLSSKEQIFGGLFLEETPR